jgi:hypothetical protein
MLYISSEQSIPLYEAVAMEFPKASLTFAELTKMEEFDF